MIICHYINRELCDKKIFLRNKFRNFIISKYYTDDNDRNAWLTAIASHLETHLSN